VPNSFFVADKCFSVPIKMEDGFQYGGAAGFQIE
jgi:hypothetical protein